MTLVDKKMAKYVMGKEEEENLAKIMVQWFFCEQMTQPKW